MSHYGRRVSVMVATLAVLVAVALPAQASAWRWSADLSPGQSSSVLSFFPRSMACAPVGTYNYYVSYFTSYGRRWY